MVTPDNVPVIDKFPPVLTAPLIPTPPVTTNVPVVVLDDTVPAVNVIAPDADNDPIPEIPLDTFKTNALDAAAVPATTSLK